MHKNFLIVEILASQMKDEPKEGRPGCGVVIAAASAITVLAGVRKQMEQASERASTQTVYRVLRLHSLIAGQ